MPGTLNYFFSLRTRNVSEHHKERSVRVSSFLSVRQILERLLSFQYYQNVIKMLVFFILKAMGYLPLVLMRTGLEPKS